MPWTTRVDPANRVSYIVHGGVVTFSDLVDSQVALSADPKFDTTFPLLVDLRAATDLVLTRDEMHGLVAIAAVAPSTRRALLVGHDGVSGVAHLYETLRQTWTDADVLRACRTADAAAAWLGVPHLDI